MTPMSDSCDFIAFLEEGCRSWRQGDDQKGIGQFQQACLLWLEHLEEQERRGELPAEESLYSLVQAMEKFLESTKDHDIIRSSDILEYEILPLTRALVGQRRE